MAIVSISLDTATRNAALTINGVLVPVSDCFFEKYEYDGEEFVRFSYTVEIVNSDGLQERRQFYLPAPTEAVAELDKHGLASRNVCDLEKGKADAQKYFEEHCFGE